MAKKIPLLCVLWIIALVASSVTAAEGEAESSSIASPSEETSTTPSQETSATLSEETSATLSEETSATLSEETSATLSEETSATPSQETTATPSQETTATPSSGSTSASTTASATTKPPNPCESSPCGSGSTCEARAAQFFVCLCLPGETYNIVTKSCEKAKVFPGYLTLSVNYESSMQDKTSEKFREISDRITTGIGAGFVGDSRYTTSTVLELREANIAKGWLIQSTRVEASVEIIFKANADITEEDISKVMDEAISCADCPLAESTFDGTDLCASNACDISSTLCTPTDGYFTCKCKDGYVTTDFSSRVCLACPSGQKADGSDCVDCPFGYSGFNCQEDWELILVIVGSVLGALLLITIILLSVFATKSKKRSKKSKNADIGKPYISHSAPKAPLANGSNDYDRNQTPANGSANVGVPRIPRATTTSSWDRRNNLEMTPSNSRQNLISAGRNQRLYDDPDDTFSYQARPQGNPYTQAQPQNNPYAQNRASINPYAQREGHSNPYFVSDNGGRFN